MTRIALVGGQLLNPEEAAPRYATLLVEGGYFSSILEPEDPVPDDFEVFDASGHLIIPGLINAHMHSHANILRGLCNSWCLEMSLLNGPWMSGPRDPEAIYASTLLGAYEMISNGVTACYDLAFEYPFPTMEGLSAMAAAYRDAGMRVWLAPMIADRSFFDAIPGLRSFLVSRGVQDSDLSRGQDGSKILATCQEFFEREDWETGKLQPAIAPTIALHCSSEFMRDCKGLARSFGARVHMHVAESRVQAQAGRERYGDSILAETERLGLLDETFTAAHGVWLNGDDFRRLSNHGSSLIHIPGSNMRLGCGVADIRGALDQGVTVGLATDGANSSDSLSVFRAMQLAAMASRVSGSSPEQWLGSSDVFQLATTGNAAAVGQAGKLGKIATGYRADCVLLSLDTLTFSPSGETLNQMVNAESGSSVRSVMVDGKWILQGGSPNRFDGAEVLAKAEKAAVDWKRATGGMRAKTEPLVAPVVEYTQTYGQSFTGARSYLG